MNAVEELFATGQRMQAMAGGAENKDLKSEMKRRQAASQRFEKAHSGSWLGYHSRVYTADLEPARPGQYFSSEWGMIDRYSFERHSRGDWAEHDYDGMIDMVKKASSASDLSQWNEAAEEAREVFADAKGDAMSIITGQLADQPDVFLEGLRKKLEGLHPLSTSELAFRLVQHPNSSRDQRAVNEGFVIPPHVWVNSEAVSIFAAFDANRIGAEIINKAASHIERTAKRRVVAGRLGTNVFIGHGRSPLWRELKDFVQDRLSLPADEFNRVPIAGQTNIARLVEMLDAAAIAFLVMTAEDETSEGKHQARMNVVHEVGLFQGRLGFTKAIIMLEEGCEEFSNVQGLGQIRFPKGNIKAAFEDVRSVIEREGLI